MKPDLLKTLWMLRFEKLRKSEEAAAWTYQEILDHCLVNARWKNSIAPLLAQLVKEERMHERLAEELIRVCHRNHPECSVL